MMQSVVADFGAYFRGITEDRRRHPREDLATVIANARIGGDYMPDHDATSYYMIVATAGHDTTSSSTAGAIWALAQDPAQFEQVKANPELIPGLVDEAIRWMTPVKHFMRSATADTELGGRKIAKGDWLMLCYASGNRDEDVFEEPYRFRSDRKPNRHVAFGYGAHLCLGQYLAKLEMRILFEELLPRLKSIAARRRSEDDAGLFRERPEEAADPVRGELILVRHSGAMRSIELWCAIAHLSNLEVPGPVLRTAPERQPSSPQHLPQLRLRHLLQRRARHVVDEVNFARHLEVRQRRCGRRPSRCHAGPPVRHRRRPAE